MTLHQDLFSRAIKPGDEVRLKGKVFRLEAFNILNDRAAVSWIREDGVREIEQAVLSEIESENGSIDWFAELGYHTFLEMQCIQWPEFFGSPEQFSEKKQAIIERLYRCKISGSVIHG